MGEWKGESKGRGRGELRESEGRGSEGRGE